MLRLSTPDYKRFVQADTFDVTYGGGGHSKEILKKLSSGKLIAFDQDADAMQNKTNDTKLILVKQNFMLIQLRIIAFLKEIFCLNWMRIVKFSQLKLRIY